MDDIKQRLNKVDRILIGHSPMKHEGLDAEVVCLLIRKSLEQLAFSSLIAHKEAYVDVYNDFSKTWRAKQLLDRLKTVHPEFYPRPVRFSEDATPPVKHLLDAPDGFLTQEEFVFLYDCCSQAIHTWNPFTPGPRVIDTQRPLTEWVNRIKTLLDLHYVRLAGEQGVWVVQMNHPVDGKVHAFPAQ